MKSKKGVQLTINFLVIIIISLVIFTLSMKFAVDFFKGAESIKANVDAKTEAEMREAFRDGSLVSIPINKKIISVNDEGVFGLGIQNIMEDNDKFVVSIDFQEAFAPNEIDSLSVEKEVMENWLLFDPGPHTILPNEYSSIPILASPKGSGAGVYIFNVCVLAGTQTIPSCTDYSGDLYSDHKYKMYVRVP